MYLSLANIYTDYQNEYENDNSCSFNCLKKALDSMKLSLSYLLDKPASVNERISMFY